MSLSLKPVRNQVLVITGASSGIGLATARMAAAQGAGVVLAARNGDALARLGREMAAAGGQVVTVTADVAVREDIDKIAAAAVARFGGFDTWVNNAGVGIWGRLDEVSDEDNRRLFDTNFWGTVYGSLAAVRHLERRGGALVNVGSVASDVATPLLGMYSASKHAVAGFTDSLRIEVEEKKAPVSVTLIRPTGIDTPFPQHARNYGDKEPVLPSPTYTPDEVARAILHAAAHPVRDLYVGGPGRVQSGLARHFPGTMDWLGARVQAGLMYRDEPARDPRGALHRPGRDGDERGDHPGYVRETSVYGKATRNPVLAWGLLTAAGFAAAAAVAGGRA